MNLKKILATVAASALAVSAMSLTAFAEDDPQGEWFSKTMKPNVQIYVSTGDESEFTVDWTVATKDNDAAFKGSATITGGNWWAQKEIVKDESDISNLIGEVKPEDVVSVTFSTEGEQKLGVAYHNTSMNEWKTAEFVKGENATVTDIALTSYDFNKYNGEFTSKLNDNGEPDLLALTVFEDNDTVKENDVIFVSVNIPWDLDASKMILQLKGFNTSWGGWEGPKTEEGNTTLLTTVKDIMEANNIEKIEDLKGVNLEISGLAEDVTVSYYVGLLGVEDTDTPDDPEDPEETDPEETDPEETDPEETTEATGDATDNTDKNQPTGLAIAIVPAVVAVAGVIISKKRK